MKLMNALIQAAQGEFTRQPDGSYTITQRGLARLADVTQSAISQGLSRSDKENAPKLLESLLAQGVCPDKLAEAAETGKIPDTVAAQILAFYAFESKVQSQQARALVLTFATIGFRKFLDANLNPEPIVSPALPSQALIDQTYIIQVGFPIFKHMLVGAGISEERALGHLVRRVERVAPLFAGAFEGADRLIETSLDGNTHNPTELWGMLKVNYTPEQMKELRDYLGLKRVGPSIVNQLLVLTELQQHTPNDVKQEWKLTSKGKDYGVVTVGPWRNQPENTDGFYVRWYARVLDLLQAAAGRILLEIGA